MLFSIKSHLKEIIKMESYMHTLHQHDEKTKNANLIILKAKLESLEKSFKNNTFTISNDDIAHLTNSNFNNKITAWNWSKSFSQ